MERILLITPRLKIRLIIRIVRQADCVVVQYNHQFKFLMKSNILKHVKSTRKVEKIVQLTQLTKILMMAKIKILKAITKIIKIRPKRKLNFP